MKKIKLKDLFSFTLLNYVLWCLLSLKYYFTSGFFGDSLGIAFTALNILGHLVLFAAGMFALLVLFYFILPGNKTLKTAAVFIGIFFALFFMIDVFIYSQYRFHISLAMLELFFGPAGREIFVLPASMYVLTALAVALVAAFECFLLWLAVKINLTNRALVKFCIALLLFFTGFNLLYGWGKFMAVPSIVSQITYLPWENPLSFNRRLRKMGFEPRDKTLTVVSKGSLNYPLAPLQCKNTDKMNILLIAIDSLRLDSFNPQVMPNSYAQYEKAKNAFNFKKNYSGGNATQAGIFSLFYGLPSTYWNSMTAEQRPPVFMEELRAQGYQQGIFSSSMLNSPEFHKNIFSHIPDFRMKSDGDTKYDRDIDMQSDFIDFIVNRDKEKPFFGFLFYDSPHGFAYPKEYKEVFTPAKNPTYFALSASTDPEPYLNIYKNSVHFVDSMIGEVFKFLEKQDLLKNTVVILTGDHGQEINDTRSNFWGHNGNFTKYQTQTPLVIFWPGKEGHVVEQRTSHYDIVPTLMQDVLGCVNPPSDYSVGYNLFDPALRTHTVIVSYTNKAISADGKVSVINNYGSLSSYDDDYKKTANVDADEISKALKDISRFYK